LKFGCRAKILFIKRVDLFLWDARLREFEMGVVDIKLGFILFICLHHPKYLLEEIFIDFNGFIFGKEQSYEPPAQDIN